MIRSLGLRVMAVLAVAAVAVEVRAVVPTVSTFVGGSGDWIVDVDDVDQWQHTPPPIPLTDFFLYPDNNLSRFFIVYTGTGSNDYLRLRNILPTPVTINDLHVRASDTFEVDGTTLQIAFPGFVDNAGTMILDDGQLVTAVILPGLLSVDGGGSILMRGDAVIGSLLGAVHIDDQAIRGEGLITGTVVQLDAAIDANLAGETLNLTFGVSGRNEGDLFASDGGKLEIKSAIGDLADFAHDGWIQARRGGVVELRDMSMDNDALIQAIDNGIVQFKNIDVDNGGVIDVQHGQATLRGDVVIRGGMIQTGPGGWVVVSEGTNDFTNGMTLRGQFRVAGGAVLDMEAGSYDAQGAVFEVDNQLNLHHVTMTGGAFRGQGRAYIRASSTLVGATIDGGHVYLPGSRGFDPQVLTLIDRLTMHDDGVLTIEDHTVGFGSSDGELRISGPVTIDGDGGVIRFGQSTFQGHNNMIRAASGGHLTVGEHIRIEAPGPSGGGYIEAPLTNYGTIDANGGQIYLQSPSTTNRGIIASSAGGTIHLRNSVVIDNVGGQITAGEGTTIQYTNATIFGGTLNGRGVHRNAGHIHLNGASQPVTLDDALYSVPGNTRLIVTGELINNGTIAMSDQVLGFGTINAELWASGAATISGSGTILLDRVTHSNNNHEFTGDAGSSFTFGPNLVITDQAGTPGVGRFQRTVHNKGVIQTHGGRLTFINEQMSNRGVIRAVDGGLVEFGLATVQQQIDNTDGVLYVDPASRITLSGVHVGATLRGGTIAGGGEVVLTPRGVLDGTGQRITIQDATVRLAGNSAFGALGYIYGEVHLDNGTIALRTVGGHGRHNVLHLAGDNPRITGVGSIFFEPEWGTDNTILASGPFTIDPGITVGSVSGGVGLVNIENLTNHGVVQADGGNVLVFANVINNTGELRAMNGGTLRLGDVDPAWITLDNAGGGRLVAEPGALIMIGELRQAFGGGTGGTVHGGTFTGGGTIQLGTTTYLISTPENPVTLGPATLLVRSSTNTYFNGTFDMAGGTIRIDDNANNYGSFDPVVHANGPTHLTGTGAIVFGPAGHNLGNYLRAEGANSWNLDRGVNITAPTSAIGYLDGTINTHGTIHSDGNLHIYRGVTTVYDDGFVTGSGAITVHNGAHFFNHGVTSPGNSPGTLTIHGHYAHTESSRLVIELGGTAAGMFDVLNVNGQFIADGTLDIVLIDGFIPEPHDVFQILTATRGITGTFDNILVDNGIIQMRDGYFTLSQTGTTLTLSNFVPAPLPEPAGIVVVLTSGAVLLRRREK